MRKVEATGFDDYVADDRPSIYVSGGKGNLPDAAEVHLTIVDSEADTEIRFWVKRDDLLNAIRAAEGDAGQ